ncbi:uncharacterized protein FA14DRAFT_176323 [Meira miltonrushii]|uniref:Uncharacterized protein n=1 Tax=Meira miltonrushii TaxID=1280837 RepID=A0A316VLP6_9BASI|nr:uncharacterized protein FA14DRAFT_176323 [Meira miltonrushii]PWN37021.1 hypothetical protein FA14DRAFT_176323 [Meira miltonrushii]
MMMVNSLQIFLLVFFTIFQHVRTYSIPPSSSSSASDSGSIDWDEYINWPKDEPHGAHHDEHMVKPKAASDRHSVRSNDIAKPVDQHAGSVSPGPQSANSKKRKSPSPSSPKSEQSAASPTSGGLTDAQHLPVFGVATYAPHSPEPLSQDIDIENLMFLPPHESSSHQSIRNDESVVMNQPSNQMERGKKPLSQDPKAVWMREYRKQRKADSLDEKIKREKEAVERRKMGREKKNKSKVYVQYRRKYQSEMYKRLKETRGYGKMSQITTPALRKKVKQGIPMTPEETLFLFAMSQVHCTESEIALRRETVYFEQNDDSLWEKRQNDLIRGGNKKNELPTFHWPEIDGPLKYTLKMLNGTALKTGYWTFNQTFDDRLQRIGAKNLHKAQKILFDETVRKAFKWRDDCWAFSNASAKANNRTNTLARVAVFPYNTKGDDIDGGRGIASPVKFACFERAKDGKRNVPVVNHTIKLLKQEHWDKQSAIRQVQKRIRDDKRRKKMKKAKQSQSVKTK